MKAIPLTQGQFAFVDDADHASVSTLTWYAAKWRCGYYAQTKLGSTVIQMQRFLASPKSTQMVDHWNHDTLDNRRTNLRICSPRQNSANQSRRAQGNKTSKYKGVCWHSRLKKWQAYIGSSPKTHIAYYLLEEDAAMAYDRAALLLFGRFALLNNPVKKVPLISETERQRAIELSPARTVIHWRHKLNPGDANARASKFFSHAGRTETLPKWSELTGINRKTLYKRVSSGMPFHVAISMPINVSRSRTHCLPNMAAGIKSPRD
jgi:HNH endonuclease/AP2 domain